jgi:hypothetical protein
MPGYMGNKNLKAAGVKIEFTQEQVEEYIRCANDPKYFAKKYVKVVTLDKGITPFELYDFQEKLVDALCNNRFVIGKVCRQAGKTTTVGCCYLLHKVLFNQNMKVAILANKLNTARDILGRIREAYEHLPQWLQQGIIEWNKGSIQLENGSKIIASATSSTAIRGESYNCIFLDEFAYVPTTVAEEFFSSVYPTITAGQSTQMIIISTPRGLNMFYQLWKTAVSGESDYTTFEVSWREVPQYPGGPLRDDAWKEENKDKEFYLQDTSLFDLFPEVRELIRPYGETVHRVRFMRLKPGGGELERHTDQVDPDSGGSLGKLARIHFPIKTNEKVMFTVWNTKGEPENIHMKTGECWFLDTRKPHMALNGGDEERIHLVVDIITEKKLHDKLVN